MPKIIPGGIAGMNSGRISQGIHDGISGGFAGGKLRTYMATKDEPRALSTLRGTKYPEGGWVVLDGQGRG